MRRVTLEEVQLAYEKTRYTPIFGTFAIGSYVCPLGAVFEYFSNVPIEQINPPKQHTIETCLLLQHDYVDGFIKAIDNCWIPDLSILKVRAQVGFRDGMKIAAALFGHKENNHEANYSGLDNCGVSKNQPETMSKSLSI